MRVGSLFTEKWLDVNKFNIAICLDRGGVRRRRIGQPAKSSRALKSLGQLGGVFAHYRDTRPMRCGFGQPAVLMVDANSFNPLASSNQKPTGAQ